MLDSLSGLRPIPLCRHYVSQILYQTWEERIQSFVTSLYAGQACLFDTTPRISSQRYLIITAAVVIVTTAKTSSHKYVNYVTFA
jgi:hypothetical protein